MYTIPGIDSIPHSIDLHFQQDNSKIQLNFRKKKTIIKIFFVLQDFYILKEKFSPNRKSFPPELHTVSAFCDFNFGLLISKLFVLLLIDYAIRLQTVLDLIEISHLEYDIKQISILVLSICISNSQGCKVCKLQIWPIISAPPFLKQLPFGLGERTTSSTETDQITH